MRFKKLLAGAVAAAMAVTCLPQAMFAEEPQQAEDEILKLMTAEVPKEFNASVIYVEGVGLVDISGETFDLSEDKFIDKADVNPYADFDGIGYISEDNLKTWQETGVLTFNNLKTDFDTEGLYWGIFSHSSEYIQLVRMNDMGEVTERGLYRITDSKVTKLCDLDTFWTATRPDGVSVGFNVITKEYNVKREGSAEPYTREFTTELQMVITQPDGIKKTETIAKSDLPENGTITVDDSISYIADYSISSFYGGDTFAYVLISFYNEDSLHLHLSFAGGPIEAKEFVLYGCYTDGTVKKVYGDLLYDEDNEEPWKDNNQNTTGLRAINDIFCWYSYNPPIGQHAFYLYDAATGEIEIDMSTRTQLHLSNVIDDKLILTWYKYYNGRTTVYAVFDGVQDIKNIGEKTLYKDLYCFSLQDKDYLYFEDLNGKKGFMDLDENVLMYVDDFNGLTSNYYYSILKALGSSDDNIMYWEDVFMYVDDFNAHASKYYCPILKDGKAYLIDKDLTAVSKAIEADGVTGINDDLFLVSNDGSYYFVTAKEIAVIDYESEGVEGFHATAEEGVLPDGTSLIVSVVEDKTDENGITYNISFMKGGTEVQPEGKVTVKIPVPEAFKDKTIHIYRLEKDGTYTSMKAAIEDGYIVFTTTHFSKYIVTTEKLVTTIRGDVNNSGGDPNNDDLIMLAQYLANWNVEINMEAANVDGDPEGTVNNDDLIMLAQLLAGWNV